MTHRLSRFLSAASAFALASSALAQPVVVRYPEGLVRGFLVIRSQDGAILAHGDSTQVAHGGAITNRMIYRFKDGSTQDETVVFTQNGHFKLLSDHLIQKGPTFKKPMDVMVNASTGQVTVHSWNDKGEEKVESEQMKLPPDLANGMVPYILKNLPAGVQSTTQSMIVATPKPMLIKLQIHAEGEDPFTAGGASHKATRYNVKVDIGGIKGVIAPIVGKQPPDTQVWMMKGDCPSFLRSVGPSFEGGPIWTTELVSPVWPEAAPVTADRQKR